MGESSDSNAESPRRSLPPAPPLARAAPPTPTAATLPFSATTTQAAFPPSSSLGPRSPSCPAFSTLQEIPNETLPSDSTVTQNLTLLASPTIIIPPIPSFSSISSSGPILSPSSAHARSISQPLASPSLNKPLPSPSLPTPTTKRAHLLHEIHSTERSYALDLALVRDAYIQRLRPTNGNGMASGATTAGEPTPTSSSRNSIYTSTEVGVFGDDNRNRGPRRISVSSTSLGTLTTSPLPPSTPFSPDGFRSPPLSDAASLASASNSYFPSYGSSSVVTSPRFVFSPGSTTSLGGVGPLSTADVRAVFLNVEALAALAEEFASVLERMAGKEEGMDMVGEAFLTMMPRIKQAYTSYCPRQSAANVRLVELLGNPSYSSYFAECWSIAQPHTKAWDLPSLLIKPVQRVLKYPLLLDDLLKCTPPHHPDFENLEKAAKLIKSVADEINEVKRRKDTVDRIMNGKHAGVSSTSSSSLTNKDSKSKRGVKMGFSRKSDKDRVSSASSSIQSAAGTAAAVLQFTPESYERLRETEEEYARLVSKLMVAEATAKKMGKLVASSGIKAREVWIAQRQTVEGWRRLINLGGMEPVEDIRIEAYRGVVHEILEGPCRAMDEELRDSLVPNLVTLFNICKGPRTVILKRNAKNGDYNRVVISKNKGEWDRLSGELVEGAQIFVALHHQLLAELPALLDGFAAILDLIVTALAACHARFHREVGTKLQRFWEEFPPVVMDGELGRGEGGEVGRSDGVAIVRVWEEASRSPREMMESLAITRKFNVRVMEPPTLIASGSSTPNPHGIISRSSSNMSIRRSDTASSGPRTSVASNSTSSSSSLPFESRSRSSSNARPPLPSPTSPLPLPGGETKTGMFHFRTKSKGSKLERHGSQNALTPTPSLTPPSLPLTSRSQTLPPVPTSSTHIPIPLRTAPKRNSDHSLASSHGPALSALSFEGSDTNPDAFSESVARRLSHPDDEDEHHHHQHQHRGDRDSFNAPGGGGGFSNGFDFEQRTAATNGDVDEQPESPLTPVHPYAASAVTPTKANGNGRGGNIKLDAPPRPPQVQINRSAAADDEKELDSPMPTLYRCECVADFDLRGLSISYMEHDFLSIRRGEEIDVVFEIGRVDELDNFPLDVGLEDDGLLIGRDQNGLQGFVLCSFLHPLEANE
ncbi:hypothetical protein BDY24DRAFT_245187 [Mrakia frigida]|uniref:uncharacterized protein n=1 Tax=Mrakia frigida TaxID=29902 RepID=UPI003FCC088A